MPPLVVVHDDVVPPFPPVKEVPFREPAAYSTPTRPELATFAAPPPPPAPPATALRTELINKTDAAPPPPPAPENPPIPAPPPAPPSKVPLRDVSAPALPPPAFVLFNPLVPLLPGYIPTTSPGETVNAYVSEPRGPPAWLLHPNPQSCPPTPPDPPFIVTEICVTFAGTSHSVAWAGE